MGMRRPWGSPGSGVGAEEGAAGGAGRTRSQRQRAGWASAGPGGELGDRRTDGLLEIGTPWVQARLHLPALCIKQGLTM